MVLLPGDDELAGAPKAEVPKAEVEFPKADGWVAAAAEFEPKAVEPKADVAPVELPKADAGCCGAVVELKAEGVGVEPKADVVVEGVAEENAEVLPNALVAAAGVEVLPNAEG